MSHLKNCKLLFHQTITLKPACPLGGHHPAPPLLRPSRRTLWVLFPKSSFCCMRAVPLNSFPSARGLFIPLSFEAVLYKYAVCCQLLNSVRRFLFSLRCFYSGFLCHFSRLQPMQILCLQFILLLLFCSEAGESLCITASPSRGKNVVNLNITTQIYTIL